MTAVFLIGMMTVAANATNAANATQPANAAPEPAQAYVAARVADQLQLPPPDSVQITGLLGRRIDHNRIGRLMRIPMAGLLKGFQHRPGTHPWIGEHIGKWLHAATLAWQ